MKGKALAAVIGVFLLGLIGGAILGQLYPAHGQWGWHADGFGEGGSHRRSPRERGKHHYIHILSEELNLSEKQKDEIRPLLTQSRRKLYAARLASITEYDQIIVDLGKSIRPSLNHAQIAKLDRLTHDFRDRRARKRARLEHRLEQLRATLETPQPNR